MYPLLLRRGFMIQVPPLRLLRRASSAGASWSILPHHHQVSGIPRIFKSWILPKLNSRRGSGSGKNTRLEKLISQLSGILCCVEERKLEFEKYCCCLLAKFHVLDIYLLWIYNFFQKIKSVTKRPKTDRNEAIIAPNRSYRPEHQFGMVENTPR